VPVARVDLDVVIVVHVEIVAVQAVVVACFADVHSSLVVVSSVEVDVAPVQQLFDDQVVLDLSVAIHYIVVGVLHSHR
jgi:hypothetical protein